MKTVRILYHLARADFLERVRRSSFLVTLVGALYLGYIYLPTSDAGYMTVAIDNVRGVYNSAWIGAVCSLMSSVFVSLIGFYLVKNAVTRDYQTRVGQILAATPLGKFNYLLGKTLSNFAVFAAIVLAVLASAGVMQLIRGEDTSINLWQLVGPTLLFAMPYLLIIAALAVLFEVTPVLRGAMGNVIYFFTWNVLLIISALSSDRAEAIRSGGVNDVAGLSQILAQISHAAHAAFTNLNNNISLGIQIVEKTAPQSTFVWSGVNWSAELILQRLLWVLAAIGIVLVATPIFRRFDSVEVQAHRKAQTQSEEEAAGEGTRPTHVAHLGPYTGQIKPSLVAMTRVELRLMFRSVNRWWMIGAIGLVLATLLAPMAAVRQFIFPIAWIWPLAIWSSMGTREKKFGVEQIVFSCPMALTRQFPAIWLAGITVAFITGMGTILRLLVTGDLAGTAACVVGAVFIPTLALVLGAWSGSAVLFESVYVALWYIGPMNQVPLLDFMGASVATTPANTSIFAILIPVLAILAYWGRRRQMTI